MSESHRDRFVRLLTRDSVTKDRRRNDYNQAIFSSADEGGYSVWSSTDLEMVLDKYDSATEEKA